MHRAKPHESRPIAQPGGAPPGQASGSTANILLVECVSSSWYSRADRRSHAPRRSPPVFTLPEVAGLSDLDHPCPAISLPGSPQSFPHSHTPARASLHSPASRQALSRKVSRLPAAIPSGLIFANSQGLAHQSRNPTAPGEPGARSRARVYQIISRFLGCPLPSKGGPSDRPAGK